MTHKERLANGVVLVIASQPELSLIEYRRYGVYLCPADDRYGKLGFWQCSHLAFYVRSEGKTPGYVHPEVLKIEARVRAVLLTPEGIENVTAGDLAGQDVTGIKNRLRALIAQIVADTDPPPEGNRLGNRHQVLFLSKPDAAETLRLKAPITNNKRDKNGKTTAFTQKFRYVDLARFKTARRTSDLEIG